MSIVIAYANQERAVIKSDGRELDLNGNIVSEDSKKIQTLSDECIIGYTGNKQYCEGAIECFKQNIKHSNPLDDIFVLQSILQKTFDMTGTSNFIIVGKHSGKIILLYLSYQDRYSSFVDKSPYKEPRSIYTGIVSGVDDIESIDFVDLYDNSKSLEANMNDYIRYIASLNNHVNDHICTRKLRI